MKTIYSSLVLIVSLVVLAFSSSAQMFSYTAGTSNNIYPLQSQPSNNKCQYIYQPSVHFPTAPSGNITKIYIMANTAVTAGVFTNLSVSMAPTALSSFPNGTYITGLTPVYNAVSTPYPAIAAGGWFEVILQTPFPFNSGSNFIVEISQTAYTGSGIQVRPDNTANARIFGTVGSATGSAGAGLLNFGIDVVPSGPCTSPPTAGTTFVSATNLCSNSSLTLGLTGNSYGSGQTYQWQTSTSASGPWSPLGPPSTLSPYYTTNVTTTQFYRGAITCGTSTSYSNPVQVTVPGLFPAGTYTIDGALPTGGTNFQTFNAAVAAISCGTAGPVVFNVASGTYNEQVSIPQINTNSATNTITFNGDGATITFNGTISAPHTFMLNGADWIRVNNLNIEGTNATYGLPGHLCGNADNNIFNGCSFTYPINSTSTSSAAFSISGSTTGASTSGDAGSNNLIIGCNMTGGYFGCTVVGNISVPSLNNQIKDCDIKDYYVYGMYNLYNTNLTISNNNLERPTRTVYSSFYGIYGSGVIGLLLEKNKIHDPFVNAELNTNASYCIYISGDGVSGNEIKIYNNIIYNIKSSGTVYGLYLLSSDFIKVFHNTVNLDHTSTTAGTVYAIYNSGTTGGIEIRNNIVTIARTGTGTKYGYFYTSALVQANNNNLFMQTNGGLNYYGYYLTTYANYTAWRTANAGAWESAGTDMDPIFTNPASGDLKPNNLSLDNLGVGTPVATDITNAPRLNPPDMGAFEFGSGCPSVTGLAVSAINANGATFNWVAPTGGASGYQYVINQSASDPVIPGTSVAGTTLTVNNLLPLTSYYFHVRVVCPGGGFSFWKNVFFNTPCKIPSGALRLSGDSILCPNQAITLSTDTAYNVAYQWLLNGTPIPGATSASYATSTDGTYSVVSTQGICTKTSTSVRLKTDSTLIATVTYAGLPTACDGGRITLTANSGSGFTYEWLKNGAVIPTANSSVYVAEYTGTYQVRIRAAAECPAVSSPIAVVIHPAPFPQITRSGNVLSTTVPYASYQWYKGVNALPGETGPTYTFVNDGNFSVKVVDTNTCAASSAAFPVNFLGIGAVSGSEVSVYPNPATDVVMISSPVAVKVVIRSMDGKTVMESAVGAAKMDVRGLSNGLYLINILDRDNHLIKTEKLTKTNR